ncbi:MAG: rod shape-determining protein MreD [Lachnospiraceae bacterium]|nr:rod shape-determining protein MreD [Lachnospiraceae bacterium]
MKKLVELLVIIICFLLQSTIFHSISFAGIVPNLMVVITSIFGFMEGRNDGMFVGFISGLLIDIFYGSVLGWNALIFLLLGYVNGIANRVFYPDDIKFPLLFISLTDVAYLFITYVTGFLFRARFNVSYYLGHIILPELVYTIIVSVLVYLPLLRIFMLIDGRFEETE